MSLFSRFVPDDDCERRDQITQSRSRLEDVVASGGELIELTSLIRAHNERNHFADRLREAYGRPRG